MWEWTSQQLTCNLNFENSFLDIWKWLQHLQSEFRKSKLLYGDLGKDLSTVNLRRWSARDLVPLSFPVVALIPIENCLVQWLQTPFVSSAIFVKWSQTHEDFPLFCLAPTTSTSESEWDIMKTVQSCPMLRSRQWKRDWSTDTYVT